MNVRKQLELEIMGASSQYPIDLAHHNDGPGPWMTVSDSVNGPSDSQQALPVQSHFDCHLRVDPSTDPAP
jgi:hypothetical protein